MHQAILGSLLGFGNPVSVHCPIGNCNFPQFSSLGLCSTCMNVTQWTTVNCSNPDNTTATCVWTPPSNFSVTLNPRVSVSTSDSGPLAPVAYTYAKVTTATQSQYDATENLTIAGWPQAIAGYPALFMGQENSVPFYMYPQISPWSMMECAFNLCEKTYTTATVANFTASSEPDPELDKLLYNTPYIDEASGYALLSNDSKYTDWEAWQQQAETHIGYPPPPDGSNLTYGINNGDLDSIMVALENVFNVTGSDSATDDPGAEDSNTKTTTYAMFASPLWSNRNDLNGFMANVSQAMTNAMRTANDSVAITGQSMTPTTYFVVRWPWLVLPIFVVVTGLILLVVCILRSRRYSNHVPLWKTFNLALLLHGARLEDDKVETATSRRRWVELMSVRKDAQIRKLAKTILPS